MTPRKPRHSKTNNNETPNIGEALADTLRRFGIYGYILWMEADTDEISVDVAVMDETLTPVFDTHEKEIAVIRWTASPRAGAGRKNLK